MPFRVQQVYAPPNPTKDCFFRLVSEAQIASQTAFDQQRQDFGYKVRDIRLDSLQS